MERIDIFGKPINFTFKKLENQRTKLGSIFTLIIVSFTVIELYYFSKDLFQKTNLKTMHSDSMIDVVGPFIINYKNFPIIIGMENKTTWLPANGDRFI